jgi:hypothetical protein
MPVTVSIHPLCDGTNGGHFMVTVTSFIGYAGQSGPAPLCSSMEWSVSHGIR